LYIRRSTCFLCGNYLILPLLLLLSIKHKKFPACKMQFGELNRFYRSVTDLKGLTIRFEESRHLVGQGVIEVNVHVSRAVHLHIICHDLRGIGGVD